MADFLIRQFDVFVNPEGRRSSTRYIIVLQSELLSDTRGVIAAPLHPYRVELANQRLFPKVEVEGEEFVVLVTQLAAVPRRLLRKPACNLLDLRDRIVLALDYLFTGI